MLALYSKINKCNPSHQQLEKKNHMILLKNSEKASDKAQQLMIKILSKLGITRNFLKLIKNIYKMSTANIFNGEKLVEVYH